MEVIQNFAYKTKLKTSKKQKQVLINHIFSHNQAFNILLNLSNQQFEDNKSRKELNEELIYLTNVEQDNIVKSILRDRKITFNTKVVQQTRMNFNKQLQETIKNFKSGKKSDTGMLKFKNSTNMNNQSFETTKEQYSIKQTNNPKYKMLQLFKMKLKMKWTKQLNSTNNVKYEFKSIKISLKNNEFYVSFNITKTFKSNKTFHKVKSDITKLTDKQLKGLKSASMDINIDNIDLALIGKSKYIHKKFSLKDIKNDNLEKRFSKKLKRLQRKNSRKLERSKKTKSKLSKNFHKTQNKINKIKEYNNCKKVFNLHKIVNGVIKELKDNNINHLVVEDLNVKEMTIKTTNKNKIKLIGKSKTKQMKKNILHISFGMLINILKYKCADNEIYFELIDPKNTSKTCNQCKNINTDLQLKDRIYNCECGFSIDRDLNSCLNIFEKSIKLG